MEEEKPIESFFYVQRIFAKNAIMLSTWRMDGFLWMNLKPSRDEAALECLRRWGVWCTDAIDQ